MKKRILALALAGTTAFSVFGAAMSANALGDGDMSAHVFSSNDVYKRYTPVAGTITSTYNPATTATKYSDKNPGTNWGKTFTLGTTTNHAQAIYEDVDTYVLYNYAVKEDYREYTVYAPKGETDLLNKGIWIATDATDAEIAARLNGTSGAPFKTDTKIVAANGVNNTGKYEFDSDNDGVNEVYNSLADALKVYFNNGTDDGVATTMYYVKMNGAQNSQEANYIDKEAYDELSSISDYTGYGKIESNTNTLQGANGSVTVTEKKGTATKWTFNGSTSSDTTIYPWTTTTKYVLNSDGVTVSVAVNEAQPDPTVYLFDFIPANSVTASSAAIASAYNAGTNGDKTDKTGAAALLGNLSTANNTAWKAETGVGGSYGIRAEVVEDYEEFLSELILLKKGYYVDGGYTVSEVEFKDEYKDQYVSGYYYDPYTGALDYTKGWTADVYNLSLLLDDIYDSSLNQAYLNYNTSELLYLMQQYDKYIGNYINKADVEKDEWGDLLVSILESVTEDDFKKSADYKSFVRQAEDAIDAYDDAETSSMIKTAEKAMYDLITKAQTKSTGAADEKKELKSDLYGLYFNVKSTVNGTDYGYVTANATSTTTNAVLTNYSYLKGVYVLSSKYLWSVDTVNDPYSAYMNVVTTPGYYTLYPQADYVQTGNTVEKYAGNTSAAYTGTGTDEYEWFLNVYELANKVNSLADAKAVSNIVSSVNEALNDAVAALEVTKPATATAESALDEMIENYEEVLDFYVEGNGVNEEDFNATYYGAYQEALDYAEVAEGAVQVANARYMVEVAAEALTYQGAQVTVTKNDITSLNKSIKEGQDALKTIKDSKDYNAAQVTALNKAIAQAEEIVSIYNGKTPGYNKVNHASAGYVGDKDGIVKSDITGAIDAINNAIKGSTVVQGWYNNGSAWQYGEGDAYLNDGWHFIDKVWYYFDEDATAKQSEWAKIDGKWYYFNSNAGAARGWAKVDGEWYYFNDGCAMVTGWRKVDGNWYYLSGSGKMVTGWQTIDGKSYYFSKESNSLGQMLANTTTPDGYKVDANGVWIQK